MKVIYSFYKIGEEGEGWAKDITSASDNEHTFIPFNQVGYLDANRYLNAVQLDRLYQRKDPNLMRMYTDFELLIRKYGADAIVVCDAPPYHPDFLRKIPIYKVLYSHDDPESSYMRNIPYLHAYQHVFYVTPAYTEDMNMAEKMKYCQMINSDLIPSGTFDFDFDPQEDEKSLFERERDIDVLFIGGLYRQKRDLLFKFKKAFGKRFVWYGRGKLSHNLFFCMKYRYPFLVRPVSFKRRVLLHQRAKIGINVHNGYTIPNIGNQRLFYVPANGAMLISDGEEFLSQFYKLGEEAVGYKSSEDLIEKVKFYLQHDKEREHIARRGYRRVMRDYRIKDILSRSANLIINGMARIGWSR